MIECKKCLTLKDSTSFKVFKNGRQSKKCTDCLLSSRAYIYSLQIRKGKQVSIQQRKLKRVRAESRLSEIKSVVDENFPILLMEYDKPFHVVSKEIGLHGASPKVYNTKVAVYIYLCLRLNKPLGF